MKFKIPPVQAKPQPQPKPPIHTIEEALQALNQHGLYVAGVNYHGGFKAQQFPDFGVEFRFQFGPGADVGKVMSALQAYACTGKKMPW